MSKAGQLPFCRIYHQRSFRFISSGKKAQMPSFHKNASTKPDINLCSISSGVCTSISLLKHSCVAWQAAFCHPCTNPVFTNAYSPDDFISWDFWCMKPDNGFLSRFTASRQMILIAIPSYEFCGPNDRYVFPTQTGPDPTFVR